VSDADVSASDRVRLGALDAAPGEIDRDELRELYKIAIDEYRFEVSLNWQRTQYYFTINAALIAAAVGLFKAGAADFPLLIALLFALSFAFAWAAGKAIARGHTYYRRAAYKKTLIEHQLGRLYPIPGHTYGGANLGISTTVGMLEAQEILENPEKWIARPTSGTTITGTLMRMMRIFMIVDVIAIGYCVFVAIVPYLK
jgi:hypothetical protein